MGKLIYLAILTMASVSLVGAGCPAACECPGEPRACPPGVSAVPDGCGCCKVCAAQLNQDCSAAQPCDHHKGLECNYGNDVARTWGVCRARLEGRTCEYDGRIRQNGESFRAGCRHQCTCLDGAVGCAPLCAARLPPASPACPAPRLVRVPGRCCLSVDCHRGAIGPPSGHGRPLLRPRPDNTVTNELEERSVTWESEHGHKRLPVWGHAQRQCVTQTTDWSQCSRSCGMGVSSRVTNNAQCKLVKETRLCTIRPCSSLAVTPKKGKKCTRTHKSPEPLRLSYAGCRSARLYRPNYCGACVDGRCCSPRRTHTLPVPFLCPRGGRAVWAVMFVQSCKCGGACGRPNEAAMPSQPWLYGDAHKLAD